MELLASDVWRNKSEDQKPRFRLQIGLCDHVSHCSVATEYEPSEQMTSFVLELETTSRKTHIYKPSKNLELCSLDPI